MEPRFSVKKQGAWLWITGHTRAAIEKKLAAGGINGDWQICPHGEANRAATVREFIADPALFDRAQPTTVDAPAPAVSLLASRLTMPLVTAMLCMVISVANAGWHFVIFVFGLPYLIVCVGHVFAHSIAGKRASRSATLTRVSHATLLLTFLLLPDTGDGSGWIAYKVVLFGAMKGSSEAAPPYWLPPWGVLMVFLAYIVTTTWLVFARRAPVLEALPETRGIEIDPKG